MGRETIWRRFRRKRVARGCIIRTQAPVKADGGEPDTKVVEALVAALNDSSERAQTLWIKFLTFMAILAVAISRTSHRTLFLESPLQLPPVLNIDISQLGLFAVTYSLVPTIFVVFHFYVLLNLALLARKAKTFEDALVRAFPVDGEGRETFRMHIENTLFAQPLVAGRWEREGINAKLLSLVPLITLALAPVALLLMFEIKFLPYHDERITWLHRGLLALDLALVWALWPGYRSGWGVRLRPNTGWRLVWPGVLSVAALSYAIIVVTFPDEQIYVATLWLHGSTDWNRHAGKAPSFDRLDWYALMAPVNTLDLHGEDLIDDAKLKQIIEKNESSTGSRRWIATLSLRGRDLTGVNLDGADVRHVDFSGAILNRANLSNAWAEEAFFSNVQLHGALLNGAKLQGASLNRAQLQGASLDGAQLQGASLDGAQLQGAVLEFAHLQGASLSAAFAEAKPHLKHAKFSEPLGSALLSAEFDGAQLQGASLVGAQLQGASLDGAQLQGASLDGAQLQGASLDQAELQGTSLTNVCAWRADAQNAFWNDTRVVAPHTGAKDESPDKDRKCNWTAASFEELKKLIGELVPEGNLRRAATERIEQALDPTKALEGEDEMAKVWSARATSSPNPKVYERRLAQQWRKTGCAAEGAPYALRQLIVALSGRLVVRFDTVVDVHSFGASSPEKAKLAAAFLDKDCAGARGLSEDDITKLKAIHDRAQPPLANQ
jgi:uncharacterized protein YjbI with pentapeptide repeats